MNAEGFAQALIDQGGHNAEDIDPLVQAFSDRLLMRVYASPSLLMYLVNSGIRKSGNSYHIELDFKKLPDDVIHQVKSLIANKSVKIVSFKDEHGDHTGFSTEITQKDLEKARKSANEKPTSV